MMVARLVEHAAVHALALTRQAAGRNGLCDVQHDNGSSSLRRGSGPTGRQALASSSRSHAATVAAATMFSYLMCLLSWHAL
jgi:hypothetical protein